MTRSEPAQSQGARARDYGAGINEKGSIFLAARMYQAVVPVCSDA
jgi:hypothetical protein